MASIDSILFERQSAGLQGFSIIAPLLHTPAFWIRYLGTAASGATIAIAAGGDMTFTTDGTTADTSVNTTGTIDMSTPGVTTDTFGEVAALINASTNWQCYLLGVRPEDSTNNTLAVTTKIDISTAAYKGTGLYVYGDEAISYDTAFAISGFDPTKSTTDYYNDDDCYSCLQWVHVNVDCTTAAYFRVYSANQTNSTLLFENVLTDNTDTNFGCLGAKEPFIQSKLGERLIVLAVNDKDGKATDELKCSGYTVDRSGKRYAGGYALTNVNA